MSLAEPRSGDCRPMPSLPVSALLRVRLLDSGQPLPHGARFKLRTVRVFSLVIRRRIADNQVSSPGNGCMRWLVLIHRYLGISIGILIAAWCLSGIVMMYVSYPEWSQAERLRGLPLLEFDGCCAPPGAALADDSRVQSMQLEMLGSRPIVRLQLAAEPLRTIDLIDGTPMTAVSPAQALGVAQGYTEQSNAARFDRTIDFDQWTVAGVSSAERPLYRFSVNDTAGTELYVSRHSGRLVQATTARQRFWNWLGAVPHWLYFAGLRHNVRLWSAVIVWTSLAGCFLTVTGLYLGVQRFLRPGPGRWSPFRGLLLWHHIPGLLAGVFALTWVASGLVSMNPWGFLESPESDSGRGTRAAWLSGAQVRDCLRALQSAPLPAGTVSIESSQFEGRLYPIAATASGTRFRLDASGHAAPLAAADVATLASGLSRPGETAAVALISDEDEYYFTHHRDVVHLPVYRAVLDDRQHTRYYIDPVAGSVLRRVDANARWYRWLHQGLHRMDFTPTLRARPLWDALMWVLMSAVAAIGCTGAVLGMRRLLPRTR